MTPFSYLCSTKIEFGCNSIQKLPNALIELGFGRRLLLVTDPGLVDAGIAAKVTDILEQGGYSVTLFSDVLPNPRDHDCTKGAELFLSRWCDAVIAVGGGSAMDTAKTIALLARNGGKPSDYADGKHAYGEMTPLACVPTTAGTGSEVTRGAVITEADTHRKMTLKHEWMRPKLALLDPDLTTTVPKSVTAATGVDALVHAIEGYTCRSTQPISQAFGLQAMPLIVKALPKVYKEPQDTEARSDMLLGSLLAGLCFGSADVASVHCLAEALGGLYDTPHGIANAVFLLPVLEYNIKGHEAVHALLARTMHFAEDTDDDADACTKLISSLSDWLNQLDIPPLLELPGVDRADTERIVELALANNSTPSNIRTVTAGDYKAILERAFNGK